MSVVYNGDSVRVIERNGSTLISGVFDKQRDLYFFDLQQLIRISKAYIVPVVSRSSSNSKRSRMVQAQQEVLYSLLGVGVDRLPGVDGQVMDGAVCF
jgi:hypothetical protein